MLSLEIHTLKFQNLSKKLMEAFICLFYASITRDQTRYYSLSYFHATIVRSTYPVRGMQSAWAISQETQGAT